MKLHWTDLIPYKLREKLMFRKCAGECPKGWDGAHTHHMTWIGEARYIGRYNK